MNENGGVCRGDRLDLAQDPPENRAVADDLLKVQLAADLVLKVEIFLSQFIGELRNSAVRQCVVDGDGNLASDLQQKLNIALGEGVFAKPGNGEYTEHPIAANERKQAERSKTFSESRFVSGN